MISSGFVLWLLHFISKHYCKDRECDCCVFCNRDTEGLCYLASAAATAEKNFKEGRYYQ